MNRREFDINIVRLSDSEHEYEYQLEDSFFKEFENSPVEKADLHVKVVLDKNPRQIKADFYIDGTIELTCDRSLDRFDQEVSFHESLIFKFGSEYEEVSEDIIIIPADTQKLNLSQYIYEFTGLSLPMKKLHPRYQDEENEEDDDESVFIYSTGKTSQESDTDNENDFLKKLKNIKFNNN